VTTEWTLTPDQQAADTELRAACPALDWEVTFASPDGLDVRWAARNAIASWCEYEVYERWTILASVNVYPATSETGKGTSALAARDMAVRALRSQIRHRQAAVDALSPPTSDAP
jgi:hypothetical protein